MSSLPVRNRIAVLLTSILFVVVMHSTAHAQEVVDVQVETFRGAGGDDVQEIVTEVLQADGRVRVVSGGNARLMIGGSVSGRATRRTAEFTARSSSGAELAQESARMGRGAAGRRAVTAAIQSLMDAALGNLSVEASMTPPPSETRGGGETGTGTETDTETGTDEAEAEPSGDTSGDPAILAISLGAVVRTRGADIRLQNGVGQTYDGTYVEATARLELRPLAHDRGLARGLFLRLDYAHALGLGSRDRSGAQYETVFFRAFGDVGFLFGLGDVVELGASIGFGWDSYSISANPVMPGVEYPYLRPGIRLRIRLVQELVVLDADLGFRSIFGRANFTSFGSEGDSFGLDAGIGIGGLFDFGLLWRANFAWANYWHSFSGTATIEPASSGQDGGIQVGLTVGYGIR